MISRKSRGDLAYLEITNESASAKIALQGAHLFHFQAKGQPPLLWLSETSRFEKGKAIRGGIPICWPWFGAHPTDSALPNHGFARTSLWEHLETQELTEGETRVILGLRSSAESLLLWPYNFELQLEVIVATTLTLALTTRNLDTRAFVTTQALHTYLAVSDIAAVAVEGLDQKRYFDKVNGSFGNLQEGALRFTNETDRIYEEVPNTVTVKDLGFDTTVTTEGGRSVVVWNPGAALAQMMDDLSDHETMLCIESAYALEDLCTVNPQESGILRASFSKKKV